MPLTSEQRRARARLAAFTQWSREPDRTGRTAAARSAFMDRFERQVDPDRIHPPEVRAKMAEAAMRAYFVGIRLRRSRKAAGDAAS
jgi:hypothetical protein